MRKPLSDEALNYFRKEGARGGTIAAKGMTAAERKARSRKGGQAAAVARTAKRLAKKP